MRNLHHREILSLVPVFFENRRWLRHAPFFSPEKMRAWQWEKIKTLVSHAYATVPFYRDLYRRNGFHPADLRSWQDFRKLPLLSKDDVVENFPRRMISEGKQLDELIVSRSSGSTGKVLDIAYDSRAFLTFVLAGLRLYDMATKYFPWYKQAYAYTSPYPFSSVCGLFPTVFISTLAPMKEILGILTHAKPQILVCYPSILNQIVEESHYLTKSGLRLRGISTNSEFSTQTQRDGWAEIFCCPVLDEYSSEELTRIAAQCRQKTYHLFEDINYLETVDFRGNPTGEAGEIVGTNLHNFGMPMIRYRQNDLGKIIPSSCACGWKFRELIAFEGRKNDCFVMPSGKILSSGFLLDATYEFLLKYRSAVKDFCLVQETESRIYCEIVPGSGWNHSVQTAIVQRFHAFFDSSVEFSLRPVEFCRKTGSGKRNPIVNLMNRQGIPATDRYP